MIIINGAIQAKTISGGGLDENSNPIAPGECWSECIPCNLKVNTRNEFGRFDGNTFVSAKYEVLVKDSRCFSATNIRIYDNENRDLGEYKVIDRQRLNFVGAIKLTV